MQSRIIPWDSFQLTKMNILIQGLYLTITKRFLPPSQSSFSSSSSSGVHAWESAIDELEDDEVAESFSSHESGLVSVGCAAAISNCFSFYLGEETKKLI